jgi:hypothetical protein
MKHFRQQMESHKNSTIDRFSPTPVDEYKMYNEDPWQEFNEHFKRKDRTKTPGNHHDFLVNKEEYNMA